MTFTVLVLRLPGKKKEGINNLYPQEKVKKNQKSPKTIKGEDATEVTEWTKRWERTEMHHVTTTDDAFSEHHQHTDGCQAAQSRIDSNPDQIK